MKTSVLFLLVMSATLSAAAPSPKDDKPSASEQRIKDLQKERIAVLKSAVESSFKLAQAARAEFREALEDRITLLRAEVEVAEKESDRVGLYKQAVADLESYEKLAKVRYEAARGTQLDILRIKAQRLELEIQLERAQAKAAKDGK